MADYSASEMMAAAAARQLADVRKGTGHLLEAKLLIRQGLALDSPQAVSGTFSRAHLALRPGGQPRAPGEAGPVPCTARGIAPRLPARCRPSGPLEPRPHAPSLQASAGIQSP